jgi:hypothetical protein
VIVCKKTGKIICTHFANGKTHDFNLFKKSKIRPQKSVKIIADSGCQGLKKLHSNCETPVKKRKKQPLTQMKKQYNQSLASSRILNENVIGYVKRFKIIADTYRNRRKRFRLRFNLISTFYNAQS